jgi:hypothetical protein
MTGIDIAAVHAAITEQMQLLTPAGDQIGVGWVPADDVAWGTYATITGWTAARQRTTDTGYIIHSHPLPGGIGGGGADRIAVYLGVLPSTGRADADVLYVTPETVVTVLDPPPGMPAGEPAPWRRMPIEQQVTQAAAAVGIRVRVIPSDPNPLYQLDDDNPTALSRVADYLLDGGHAQSLGRARPIPHPNRVRDTRRQP